MEELRPCPFCGAAGRLYGYGPHDVVCCPNGCIAGFTIEKWNRRQSASVEIEALEAGVNAIELATAENAAEYCDAIRHAATLRLMAARMK